MIFISTKGFLQWSLFLTLMEMSFRSGTNVEFETEYGAHVMTPDGYIKTIRIDSEVLIDDIPSIFRV